jgi:Protein of unknown function (DUF2442)
MKKIVSVEPLADHRLKLRFDDGVEGTVNLSNEVGKGIFAAWRDPQHFSSVKIGRGGRSLEWPDEIDLCADALYLEITGMKVEDLFPNWKPEAVHA